MNLELICLILSAISLVCLTLVVLISQKQDNINKNVSNILKEILKMYYDNETINKDTNELIEKAIKNLNLENKLKKEDIENIREKVKKHLLSKIK